jgi:hypothetical protein
MRLYIITPTKPQDGAIDSMDQTSNSGTLCAITAITDSFVEAASRLENWRRVKKHRKSGESELRDSLEAGSDELRVGYQKLRQEYGEDFEQGDGEPF